MGDDMDKVKEVDNGFNHGITLVERKNIVISGVKKIESFDSEEFLMETTLMLGISKIKVVGIKPLMDN